MTVDEGAVPWARSADGLSAGDPDSGKPEGVYARRTRIRKQEILDSALVAFGQKGFYKATLADVASAAGITAAGLLHHFKTKEALLVELLQERDLAGLQESADGELPRGRALLQHSVDTMGRNMTRPVTTQVYAVLSAEGVTEAHPAGPWFLDRYQRLRALLVTAILDGAADGDVEAPMDVEATATAIIAVMDGLQIQWLYDPDSVDMSEVTCQVINALVRPVVPLVPWTPAAPPPPA
ncbi:MAG TPA: TetR/AcrR family transcriptional regulator [Microlunatus sp.]